MGKGHITGSLTTDQFGQEKEVKAILKKKIQI